MRIHVFFHRDIHQSSDGTSMFIRKLLRQLSRTFQLDVFTYSDAASLSVIRESGYDIWLVERPRIPVLNKFVGSRKVLKKFYDPPIASWPGIYFVSKRTSQADCVLYIDSYVGTAVAALARLHGKKLVFRPNDCLFSLGLQVFHSYSRVKGLLMLVYACVFERLASKMADVILASSGEVASTLEGLYGTRGKTFVIPPGSECEPGKEYSSVRPKYGFGKNQPLILFLGTGDHFPNRLAIQFIEDTLAPFLEREVPEARIMIVGRNTEEFRNRIKTKNLLVVGEVPETGPYLASADLAIAPMTIVGGVNAKVIEYLCGGLPTVATGVSVKALDQTSGLFASDIDHFCETVSAVIRDVDRLRSLRKQTSEQALSDYSWESIGSQVTLILNSLLRHTNEYQGSADSA